MIHHVDPLDLANQHGGQDAPPFIDYFRTTALLFLYCRLVIYKLQYKFQ